VNLTGQRAWYHQSHYYCQQGGMRSQSSFSRKQCFIAGTAEDMLADSKQLGHPKTHAGPFLPLSGKPLPGQPLPGKPLSGQPLPVSSAVVDFNSLNGKYRCSDSLT